MGHHLASINPATQHIRERLFQVDQPSGGEVALLTGGGDRPYAYGLATALLAQGLSVDIIGSDELDSPEWHGRPKVRFFNLRGDQKSNANWVSKIVRVARYYVRLVAYATFARPAVFHILWNNKFEMVDRVGLMLLYKWLGKQIVLTVHNVNAKKRDLCDSLYNRVTLRWQYHLAAHLFVHTEQMKAELQEEFGVEASSITVIPFGINNDVPNTNLTYEEARRRLGMAANDRIILFFGNVAPYKGLELLVNAFHQVSVKDERIRLLIAGRVKNCEEYWQGINKMIEGDVIAGRVRLRVEYIPDSETEVYFKSADLLVLPYRHVYQSGVLFLGYSFGLPTVAADVGALKEEIIEGETGFVCRPEDPDDLARAIEKYFSSDLYKDLKNRRARIQEYAREAHSWEVVAQLTKDVYQKLRT